MLVYKWGTTERADVTWYLALLGIFYNIINNAVG